MTTPVAYSPATFLTDLGTGAAAVLPYVGVAVTAGIALMFAFMGIKKGLAFFKRVAN
jgi:hypothetical protein